MSRRRFISRTGLGGGVVLLGGPALLAACGDDSDDSASTTTSTTAAAPAELTAATLQLSWLNSAQFAGSYLAKANGYYEAEGIDISLTPGGPNAPVDPPVVAGQALSGISAADYTMRSIAEGAPFKIVGVAMQKNPFAIVSLSENPVSTPADLEGKSIGMATINEPVLDALVAVNDFDKSAVTITPTQYDAAPLVNNEVDCLLCWLTDIPVAMTVQEIPNETMLLADFGYTVHSQTYIVTEETLAENRDLALGLLRAEIRGHQDYQDDPAAAATQVVDMFPDEGLDLDTQILQAEEQTKLMFSDDTDEHGFMWFTDESVASNVDTLGRMGIDADASAWDRSLLEEIFADGPRI